MADQNFEVTCGFFDAVNNDRLYSADQMNMPYKKLVGNGVFGAQDGGASNDFKVTASSGMVISVAAGNALFADKWFESPAAIAITVPAASVSNPRIDSVIAQVDKTANGRVGRIVYRTGTASASPTAPAINTDADIVEYRIANISVPANQTTISSSLITDLRGTSACPWVKSLLAPTTAYLETLFADIDTETDVANLQTKINGMVAGGRNLMLGTYVPDVSSTAVYPHIAGQEGVTATNGTVTTAVHGMRVTLSSATYPRFRFGNSTGSMNGLIAGQTYTLSFDCAYKIYSGDTGSSTERKLLARLYTDGSGTMTVTDHVDIATLAQADKGVAATTHVTFTFTVPSEATQAYIYIVTGTSTSSQFAVGDYLEMANIVLQVGNVEAGWSPAPEDIAVQNVYSAGVQTVDGAKITNASITSDKLSSSIVSTLIYSGTTLLGGGSINHDFSGYKKLKIYYRMPSAQGSLELDLTVSGDTTIGQQSGYDPHYTSAFIPTADNVGGYVVMVSVNTGLTKLTVQEMGYRAFDAMSTYVDRAGNSSYYITKIYGFAEVEVV